MLNASQAKPDDGLSKARFVLTNPEIARRLSISEEAARALVKAASLEAASLERRAKCANRL
jgi:hypothetical protein